MRSDEHKMLRDMCRAFADAELSPNAGKWDQAHEFPVDAVKQMSEMGLMGIAQPTDYNGAGYVARSFFRGVPGSPTSALSEIRFSFSRFLDTWHFLGPTLGRMDAMSYAIGVEEISRGCAGCGVIMSVSSSAIPPKRARLPAVCGSAALPAI